MGSEMCIRDSQEIAAVYSTNFARTRDTAKPTADAVKVKVKQYGPSPEKAWFAEMLKKYNGRNVLIVGHSNTVVPIVNGLGAKMKHKIPDSEYHSIFIVRVHGDLAQAVRINYGTVPAKPVQKKPAKQKATATP